METTLIEAIIDGSFYLSALSFIIVMVFIAVNHFRPRRNLTVEEYQKLVQEQIDDYDKMRARNNECQDEIDELRKEVNYLRADQGILERARDTQTAIIEDLKRQVLALTAKIENQEQETNEILDVSYLMLQWIKAAIVKFEGLSEDPPPLPRDILLFEKKYQGRFSKGDNDNEYDQK